MEIENILNAGFRALNVQNGSETFDLFKRSALNASNCSMLSPFWRVFTVYNVFGLMRAVRFPIGDACSILRFARGAVLGGPLAVVLAVCLPAVIPVAVNFSDL